MLSFEQYINEATRSKDIEVAYLYMGGPRQKAYRRPLIVKWKTLQPVYRQVRVWTDDDEERFIDNIKDSIRRGWDVAIWRNFHLHIMWKGPVEQYPYRRYK